MRAVRTTGTAPELLLRRELRRRGLRFRLAYPLLGRPDVAFPRRRVAVFVDGAYWHGHSWRERGFASLEAQFASWKNGTWWLAKVMSNIARDRRQTRALQRAGWRVVRLRERDVERHVERCVARIERAIGVDRG